jgi:hypothetical protein
MYQFSLAAERYRATCGGDLKYAEALQAASEACEKNYEEEHGGDTEPRDRGQYPDFSDKDYL